MSAEIDRIEKLTKLKRGRRAFDTVKVWAEEFEQEILPSLQEMAEKGDAAREALGEPLEELATAAEQLAAYELVSQIYVAKLTALKEEAEELFSEDNPAVAIVEAWEELETQLSEFEGMLNEPREYDVETKDQAWDEACTSLGNIADGLKSLAATAASPVVAPSE